MDRTNACYLLWLDSFLKASDKAFAIFQLEVVGDDLESAQASLQKFDRGIHGATETLKNWRDAVNASDAGTVGGER